MDLLKYSCLKLLVLLPLALCGIHQTYAGDCKGRREVLRSASGYVTDGPGNYSVNGNCEWLVEAPSSSYRILLTFMFMDTECTYDYLFIYDGDSPSSPLLASLSGSTLPPTIEATSGKVSQHCQCELGFVGQACDLALSDNQGAGKWYNVSIRDSSFWPRTAAAGLDLNTALGDLVFYNFTTNTWHQRVLSPSPVSAF
ncbi:hypothetical protein E2320_000720 [Naja naja]|nr:hypothetical protein E2320_000720 [Naja naja]